MSANFLPWWGGPTEAPAFNPPTPATDAEVGTPTPALPFPLPGYQLLERLGEGGRGVVYRAVQLCLNRPVAIKFLPSPPRCGADPGGAAQAHAAWQREARLMAALKHPHVVTIHACGLAEDSGGAYLVMEYIAGPSLRA